MGRTLGDPQGPEDSAGVQQGARERSVCGASGAGLREHRPGDRLPPRPGRKDLTSNYSWPVTKFVLTE